MRALITAALLSCMLVPAWADPPSAGLRVWLRADAGVFDAVGAAASDGAVVGGWADQAGGRLYGRADSWAQPRYVANAINGLPALRFDGEADRLYAGNLGAGIESSSITLFAVVTGHDASAATNEEQVIFADGGWWGAALERSTYGSGALTLYSGYGGGAGASLGAEGSLPLAGYGPLIVSARKQFGSGASIGIDGHTLATTSGGAITGPYAADWQPYSTVGYLSAGPGGYTTYDGLIAEILVYQGEMSEADYQAAGAYLADKYGLATAFAAPVPEPAAGTLLLLGLAGLLCRRPTRRVLAAALVAAAPWAQAQNTPALGFDGTNGSFLDGTTRMIGWSFSVSETLSVSALGWFDWGGDDLAREHPIGLWRSDTQALLATATVPAGTAGLPGPGGFLYQPLGSTVQLEPGVAYRVAGLDIGAGGDAHVWAPGLAGYSAQVQGFTADARIVLATGMAIGAPVAGFGYPGALIGDSRQVLMGPNLLLGPVPEPPAWALWLAGAAAVAGVARRR